MIKQLNASATCGISMNTRLFLLLIVLVVTIILGVIAILLITGTFTAGLDERETLFQNELLHTSDQISGQYGELSVQVIKFSEELSGNIEQKAQDLGISVSELAKHPDK